MKTLPTNSKLFGIIYTIVVIFMIMFTNAELDLSVPETQPKQNSSDSSFTYGKVTKVVDGDTFYVEIEGVTEKVRFIGIDTPETKHPNKPDGCYGEEATAFLTKQLLGKNIKLESDKSNTDRYKRLLRYVWLDGIFVNELLVKQGYAFSKAYPPDTRHQDTFDKAQEEAISAGKGLWGSSCNYIEDKPFL